MRAAKPSRRRSTANPRAGTQRVLGHHVAVEGGRQLADEPYQRRYTGGTTARTRARRPSRWPTLTMTRPTTAGRAKSEHEGNPAPAGMRLGEAAESAVRAGRSRAG